MVNQCTQLRFLMRIELAVIARRGFFQYIHNTLCTLIMLRGQHLQLLRATSHYAQF
ncbi:Uncharacterised protein [Klebsiella pneumoniae]|nr:Uncharacterised protein [Klebsiella pneumoniae]